MPAPYAGSTYPAVVAATAAPPAEPANVTSKPCPRVVPYVSESPLGVAYRSVAVLADGTISDGLWYDHATGDWSPTFDASRHVKALHRNATFDALQSYAAPGGIADDPSILADVFVLKPDRTVAAPIDTRPANEVSAISRGWYSKP